MTSFIIGLIVIALLAIAAACIFAWRFSKEKKLRIQREKEAKLLEPLSQREPVNEQEVEFGPGVEFDDEPEQEPMEEPVTEPLPQQEPQLQQQSQPQQEPIPLVEESEQKIVEIEEVQVGPQTVDTKVVLDEDSDNDSEDEQKDEEDEQKDKEEKQDEDDDDEDEEVVIRTRSSRRRK